MMSQAAAPAPALNFRRTKDTMRERNVSGMTLTEVLVAAVILALVLAGVANIFIAEKRYILHSRSRMSGGELGKIFLDPLQMDVRQDLWSTNCLGSSSGCTSAAQIINSISYTPAYTITDVGYGTTLRRVVLQITWNENP